MKTNPTWKDWFVFSKKERTIVLALVVLMTGYLSFLIFYQPKPEVIVIKNLDEELAQLSSQSSDSTTFHNAVTTVNEVQSSSGTIQPRLFYFDPNTLDEAGFVQLGLSGKTAHTIINYRSKGGHFYKPDDVRKIYGLKDEEANRLVPFVRISSSQSQNEYTNRYTGDTYSSYKPKPQIIDINTASAGQWQSLPAIGEVLSNRIVKYRDKIGGFTAIADVKKVYGITDSTYNIILPYLLFSGNKASVQIPTTALQSSQKININKATAAELKGNPDIPSDIAEAIIIYRKQHGNYTSVNDIKKIVFINDNIYQKIAPFLSVE